MKYLDLIKIALKNLKRRKIRTYLTTIGLVIGVITIYTIFSLSYGTSKQILTQIEKLGNRRGIILPGKGSSFFTTIGKEFSKKDVEKIEKIDLIKYVLPFSSISTIYKYKNTEDSSVILLIDKEKSKYLELMNYYLYKGKYISSSNECIVGYNIYLKTNLRLNTYIYFPTYNKKCKVVGILEMSSDSFRNNAIIATTQLFGKEDNYLYIIIKTKENILNIKEYLEEKIKKLIHRDVTIFTPSDILKSLNRIFGIFIIFISLIGIISIVISAIGIMNTMYMAVTERIKEIGIMKAIGAKDIDILFLFLIESGFIGLIGGIIGIIIGYLFLNYASIIISKKSMIKIIPYNGLDLIIFTLFFSFLVGIIAGILPAYRASKMKIIDCLREE